MFRLIEQFNDPTEFKAEIYVYIVGEMVVYGYDKYNGYVNFYDSLQSLIYREMANEPDIEFKSITKDDYDNDEVFEKWMFDNFS